MKKRIISLLMVVLLFVSLVPTGALAESRALSGVTVTFTSQPTDEIGRASCRERV